MIARPVLHTLLVSLSIASSGAFAEPLTAACPSNRYECNESLFCACVANDGPTEIEPVSLTYTKIENHVVGKNETYELLFDLSTLGPSSPCKNDLEVEIYNLITGKLLKAQRGAQSIELQTILILYVPESDKLRIPLNVRIEGQATGCTIEEIAGFSITEATYVSATGNTTSERRVPVNYQIELQDDAEPLIRPYIFLSRIP